MKTSKATEGTRKASAEKKASPKSRVKSKKTFSEEDISQKAREIYEQRMAHGEPGDALQDWLDAEDFLKNS